MMHAVDMLSTYTRVHINKLIKSTYISTIEEYSNHTTVEREIGHNTVTKLVNNTYYTCMLVNQDQETETTLILKTIL